MAGRGVLAALAALMTAGCSCSDEQVGGCAGVAVIITVVPAPAVVTDGGADADADSSRDGGCNAAGPSCTTACACDEYLEALRVAIEAATPAACVRRGYRGTVLACTPGSASRTCATDTLDEARALEAQISDYLSASWPAIEAGVSLDTCVCHFN